MSTKKIREIYFSPTNTGRIIADAFSSSFNLIPSSLDLTRDKGMGEHTVLADELAVFALPVYGGRLPAIAVERMKRVHGTGGPAVLLVLYGNRHYDDALLELKDLAEDQGFSAVAGGAFIGEHSYSNSTAPVAEGRPDKKDLSLAAEFGVSVQKKLGLLSSPDERKDLKGLKVFQPPVIPGNSPYKTWTPPEGIAPETADTTCILCGKCVAACPVDAVKIEAEQVKTAAASCIMCSGCVKSCAVGSRSWNDPDIQKISDWLVATCISRREPELFL
ncbi:MAG: 4Fe-4S dicluster domain-containing protein [Spirochaetales bacterium]|nr:4Fe-4S dicluster domain-containing protein [Spirochaetales bacterium]